MKINITARPQEGGWTYNYAQDLTYGLIELGYDVETIDLSKGLDNVRECDQWIIGGFSDWDMPKVVALAYRRNERVSAYVDGGPEVPGFIMFQDVVEKLMAQAIHMEWIDTLFFNHEPYKEWFKKYYKDYGALFPKMDVVPYPITLSRFENTQKKKHILFPGKAVYVKQPLLAAKFLEPWKEQVIFCQSDKMSARAEMEHYIPLLRLKGYDVRPETKGGDYLSLLGGAKVVVCTSLGESACVEVLEAVAAGAVPIVPDLPEFDEYPTRCKYKPYCMEDFRNKVEYALSRSDGDEDGRLSAMIKAHDNKSVAMKMVLRSLLCV